MTFEGNMETNYFRTASLSANIRYKIVIHCDGTLECTCKMLTSSHNSFYLFEDCPRVNVFQYKIFQPLLRLVPLLNNRYSDTLV